MVVLQRRRGVTMQFLVEELETTDRTVFRLLDAIEAAGLPIERVDDEGNVLTRQVRSMGDLSFYRAFGRWDLRALPVPKEPA